jgi:hypothetical protein
MKHELIYPGDRVFLAVPPDLDRPSEVYAELLDEAYPGVEFQLVESEGLDSPEVVFTYRDPRALGAWLEEQKVDKADNGVGLTPVVTSRLAHPNKSDYPKLLG